MELTQQQKDQVIDIIAQRLLAYQNQQTQLQTTPYTGLPQAPFYTGLTQTVPYTEDPFNLPLTLTANSGIPSLESTPTWVYEAPDTPENELPWDTASNELEDSIFSPDSFSDSTMLSTEYDNYNPTEYLILNEDNSENELFYDVDDSEDLYLSYENNNLLEDTPFELPDLTTEETQATENNIAFETETETESESEIKTETETKPQSEDVPVETLAYAYIPFPTENPELINTDTETLTDEPTEIDPQPQTSATLAETPSATASNESEITVETPTPTPFVDTTSQNTLSNRIQNASENRISQAPTPIPTLNPFVNATIPEPTPSPTTTNNLQQDPTQSKTLAHKQAEQEKTKQSNFLVRSGDWLQRNIFDRVGNWMPIGFLGKVIKMTGNVLTGLLKTVGHLFDGEWGHAGETGLSWLKDTAIIGGTVAGIYTLGKQIKRLRKSNSDSNIASTTTTPSTTATVSNTSTPIPSVANTRSPLGAPVSLDNTIDPATLYQQSSQKSNG